MLNESQLWDRMMTVEHDLYKAETRYHAWGKAFKARYHMVPGYSTYPRYQRYAYETLRYYANRAFNEWAQVWQNNRGSR